MVFPVVLYIIAWILALTMYATEQGYLAMELIRYVLFLSVGFHGIYGFYKNFFYGEKTASHLGWKSSQFQTVFAMAYLSFGVLGILSFWFPVLWIATAFGVSIFYLGMSYVHLHDVMTKKNVKPASTGPIFYLHIIVPLTLWLAMLFFYA